MWAPHISEIKVSVIILAILRVSLILDIYIFSSNSLIAVVFVNVSMQCYLFNV